MDYSCGECADADCGGALRAPSGSAGALDGDCELATDKGGPLEVPFPGDVLLPRVAHALSCFPVSFAGNNPAYTASTLKRILKAADRLERPIGIFPEGVAGSAGRLTDPLPGVDRFLALLAKRGWPALPAGVSEEGRFVIRLGKLVAADEMSAAPDAAKLLMGRVAELIK